MFGNDNCFATRDFLIVLSPSPVATVHPGIYRSIIWNYIFFRQIIFASISLKEYIFLSRFVIKNRWRCQCLAARHGSTARFKSYPHNRGHSLEIVVFSTSDCHPGLVKYTFFKRYPALKTFFGGTNFSFQCKHLDNRENTSRKNRQHILKKTLLFPIKKKQKKRKLNDFTQYLL